MLYLGESMKNLFVLLALIICIIGCQNCCDHPHDDGAHRMPVKTDESAFTGVGDEFGISMKEDSGTKWQLTKLPKFLELIRETPSEKRRSFLFKTKEIGSDKIVFELRGSRGEILLTSQYPMIAVN